MSTREVLCSICDRPLADGEPRYRRPDGDVHTQCFKGPRILVVDDDSLLRDLVAHAVRRNRFCQVDAVSNGHAALERIRTHVYDLILSDLRMPGDGRAGIVSAHPDRVPGPGAANRVHDLEGRSLRGVHSRGGRARPEQAISREDLDAILAHMVGPTRAGRESKRGCRLWSPGPSFQLGIRLLRATPALVLRALALFLVGLEPEASPASLVLADEEIGQGRLPCARLGLPRGAGISLSRRVNVARAAR